MTNEVENIIETIHMEDVEMKVNNTLMKRCDHLKALALKSCIFNSNQISQITSTQIEAIALDNQYFKNSNNEEILHLIG